MKFHRYQGVPPYLRTRGIGLSPRCSHPAQNSLGSKQLSVRNHEPAGLREHSVRKQLPTGGCCRGILLDADLSSLNKPGICLGIAFFLFGLGLLSYALAERDPLKMVLTVLAAVLSAEGAAVIMLVLRNWWSCTAFGTVHGRRHVEFGHHFILYPLKRSIPLRSSTHLSTKVTLSLASVAGAHDSEVSYDD